MTDLHDVLERALEKDRTMRIQKEPESAEFDTEGIADPAEVIVDLDSDSGDGEDVHKDIDNGDGEAVGSFDRSCYTKCSCCCSIPMQASLSQMMDREMIITEITWSAFISVSPRLFIDITFFSQLSEEEPDDRPKPPKILRNL